MIWSFDRGRKCEIFKGIPLNCSSVRDRVNSKPILLLGHCYPDTTFPILGLIVPVLPTYPLYRNDKVLTFRAVSPIITRTITCKAPGKGSDPRSGLRG